MFLEELSSTLFRPCGDLILICFRSEVTRDQLKEDISSINIDQQSFGGGSTSTTSTLPDYDAMEKVEILSRALLLGRLLVTMDATNPSWQGMFADILIVKGV